MDLGLATATPIAFIYYASLQKFTPGLQILADLGFTLIWSLFLNSFSATSYFTWVGVPFTVENYGAMLTCSSLIFLLYIGPLVQTAFIEDEGKEFNLPEVKTFISDPFCEEIIFRVCMVNCLLAAGLGNFGSFTTSATVFTFFKCKYMLQGVYLANALKNQKISEVVQEVCWNFAFASLLGFLYIRTASLFAVVLVNIFKSFMGFPDFGFVFHAHPLYSKRLVIAVAYLIGILSFSGLFKLNMLDYDLFAPWHS